MSPIHVLANPEVFVSQTMQKPTLSLPYQKKPFPRLGCLHYILQMTDADRGFSCMSEEKKLATDPCPGCSQYAN